jgi:hypothetical protein
MVGLPRTVFVAAQISVKNMRGIRCASIRRETCGFAVEV